MKNWLKCYHVFLSQRWLRILVYLVYPLGAIAMMNLSIEVVRSADTDVEIVYMFLGGPLVLAELFFSYFTFGGVAAKDGNRLEYLKTSVKGMPVLKTGLIVEAVRHLLWICLIQFLPLWICGEFPTKPMFVGNALVLIFVEIGMIILRRNTSFTVFMVVLAIGWSFMGILIPLCTTLIGDYLWAIVLLYVLAAGLTVYSICMVMKKARESYYDNRTEKKLEAA